MVTSMDGPAPETPGRPIAVSRALRARGLETTLLYGIDDLDPMDAQALLSPDEIEREMGRPLAHIPDQAGDGHNYKGPQQC